MSTKKKKKTKREREGLQFSLVRENLADVMIYFFTIELSKELVIKETIRREDQENSGIA